jgi:ABC-type phosphate transport system permease subunit
MGSSQMAKGTSAGGTDRGAGVEHGREAAFRRGLRVAAVCIVALLGAIFLTLLVDSLPALKTQGAGFFYRSTWDAVAGKFGSLPFLVSISGKAQRRPF